MKRTLAALMLLGVLAGCHTVEERRDDGAIRGRAEKAHGALDAERANDVK